MSNNINITIDLSSDEDGIRVSVSSRAQPDQFDAQSMKECLHQAVDMAMSRFETPGVFYVEGVRAEEFKAWLKTDEGQEAMKGPPAHSSMGVWKVIKP